MTECDSATLDSQFGEYYEYKTYEQPTTTENHRIVLNCESGYFEYTKPSPPIITWHPKELGSQPPQSMDLADATGPVRQPDQPDIAIQLFPYIAEPNASASSNSTLTSQSDNSAGPPPQPMGSVSQPVPAHEIKNTVSF